MLPAFVAFSYCKRWDWEWGSSHALHVCVGGAKGVTFFSLEKLLAYCWKLTAKLAPKNVHLILVLQVPWRWLLMCDMERGMGSDCSAAWMVASSKSESTTLGDKSSSYHKALPFIPIARINHCHLIQDHRRNCTMSNKTVPWVIFDIGYQRAMLTWY